MATIANKQITINHGLSQSVIRTVINRIENELEVIQRSVIKYKQEKETTFTKKREQVGQGNR